MLRNIIFLSIVYYIKNQLIIITNIIDYIK